MSLDLEPMIAGQHRPRGRYAEADDLPLAVLRALRAQPVVVALVLTAALISAVAVLVATTRFESAAELVVSPMPRDNPDLLGLPVLYDSGDPVRTIETAAVVVDDPEAAAAAAERLGGGWTAIRVQQAVEVVPQGQTDVLQVRASADTPTSAADIANAYTDALMEIRARRVGVAAQAALDRAARELTARVEEQGAAVTALEERLAALRSITSSGDPTLLVSQRATVPVVPAGPPRALVIGTALVAGLFFAGAAAVAANGAVGRRG